MKGSLRRLLQILTQLGVGMKAVGNQDSNPGLFNSINSTLLVNLSPEELQGRSEYLGKVTKVVDSCCSHCFRTGGPSQSQNIILAETHREGLSYSSPAAWPFTSHTCSSAGTVGTGEGHWGNCFQEHYLSCTGRRQKLFHISLLLGT